MPGRGPMVESRLAAHHFRHFPPEHAHPPARTHAHVLGNDIVSPTCSLNARDLVPRSKERGHVKTGRRGRRAAGLSGSHCQKAGGEERCCKRTHAASTTTTAATTDSKQQPRAGMWARRHTVWGGLENRTCASCHGAVRRTQVSRHLPTLCHFRAGLTLRMFSTLKWCFTMESASHSSPSK